MLVKIFIVGPPGSGKSTAGRTIQDYILQQGVIKYIARLNDYDILWEMYLDDLQIHSPDLRNFETPEHYKGFNVKPHAYAVFDEALRRASAKVKLWTAIELDQWIVVEFSRNNYTHAFAQFEPSLLTDAYILYIDAQEELRRTRLRERTEHPKTPDDHFVSDYILDTYYAHSANELSVADLYEVHRIEAHQIKVLMNNGSLEDFLAKVRLFADTILQPV